jgi:hypothetical protein
MSHGLRDFHAHNWPSRLYVTLVPVIALGLMRGLLGPAPGPWDSSGEANQYWMLLLAAWLLGLTAGGLVARLVLGPFERAQARRNGWPFQAGETVRVLVGPLSGQSVALVETWNARGVVRVQRPEGVHRRVRDVYTWVQVERVAS